MQKLTDAKEKLERLYGIKVLPVQADVSAGADNKAVVDNVVKQAIDTFGRIDVLINNAQASASGVTLADHAGTVRSGNVFRIVCSILLYAGMLSIPERDKKEALSTLLPVQDFSVIMVNVHMRAAKEGIRGLTRVAATEWGPDGINVNIVCPLAWTAQLEKFQQAYPDAFKANVKMPPAGHYADAEKEIGRVCVQLASPDFKYMNGETITLEGGMGQRP